MAILRPENDSIVNTILEISDNITKKINSSSKDVSMSTILRRHKVFGEAILNKFYKEMLKEISRVDNGQEVKGFIKPLTNTWLHYVDYSVSPNGGFNLISYNPELIENISKRLVDEIRFYKTKVLADIKTTISHVKNYIQIGMKPNSIEDKFVLHLTDLYSVSELLTTKGYIHKEVFSTNENLDELKYISTIANVLNVDSIKNDPEVQLTLKEDIKDSMFAGEELITFNELINNQSTATLAGAISKLEIKDINSLIIGIVILKDILKDLTLNTSEYYEVANVVNMFIDKYNLLLQQYNVIINSNNVVYGFTYQPATESFTLYGVEKVYNEYSQDGGKLGSIIGGFLKIYLDKYADLSLSSDSIYRIGLFKDDLKVNANENITYKDRYQKAKTLEEYNKNNEKYKSYYIFSFDKVLTPNEINKYRVDIEKYLDTLNLAELSKVDEVVIKIYKNIISKENNFKVFMDGVEEADLFIGDNSTPEASAGYAVYRMVLLYMVKQTTIV